MKDFESLIKPDLFHWEQLQQQLGNMGISEHQAFYQELQKLALGSNYAITQLVKYPDLIGNLAHCRAFNLQPSLLTDSLQSIEDIDQIKKQLRLFRHQKLVEIIYLDFCHNESVENTLLHLSQLADLLILQALSKTEHILSDKHGQPLNTQGEPMTLNIIGMGKLGGKELNFSSDIDLICVYSEDGQLKGFGQLSHTQYFTQVVKLCKQLLNESTKDGFVYRVDLRLRPWGDSGPVVLSHNAFEHYYQLHGREWEQYAMVKARIISGAEPDKEYLHSILKPFVYRRYHDYRVFDGLTQMKRKIDQQARGKGGRLNVKTGRGGIREIEFFVQAFQILKGGRNHQLQTQSLFQAIDILSQQDIYDQNSLRQIRESYCFLRMLENRIQMMNDQQTHQIPEKQNLLDRISLLMGYQDWPALEQQLNQHQDRVNDIFSSLYSPESKTDSAGAVEYNLHELEEDQHRESIQQLGFTDPLIIHQRLQDFYQSKALLFMSEKAKNRFRIFFPELLKQIVLHENQPQLLDKMLALLSSIAGRSVYFEYLYQNIPLLIRLVHLFDSSAWIAKEVTQHPILLESLLYPEHLKERFERNKLKRELKIQLNNVEGDEELELDVLRQFKRAQTIIIATAEIASEITTEQVSLYLSELAEIVLQAVYDLTLTALNRQYGEALCMIDGQTVTPGMGIIAYGKLGGYELHYLSDLDIIFLHNSSGQKQQTTGHRSIDNSTFFSRLAQKIISKISLLTAAGKLYEIDTRLRPNGASGMLVSSIDSYRLYQLKKAWVWEHQAIIRARFVAGDSNIQPTFDEIRRDIMFLPRKTDQLKKEIMAMRDKMYQAKKPVEGENIDIKHSRGGMVDIEFLVQYWVLGHANKFASLCKTTDNTGLLSQLHHLGVISDDDLRLRDIYQTFHRWLHARVLQNQSTEIASSQLQEEIDLVRTCWNKTFNLNQ